MEDATKRRLTLLPTGVLLAAVATTVARFLLVEEGVVAAEPYAVAVGMSVAMPVLLAGAYPRTEAGGGAHTLLVAAELAAGLVTGVGAVVLLVWVNPPNVLSVGGGAAATYVGAIAARAVVLGRPTDEEA